MALATLRTHKLPAAGQAEALRGGLMRLELELSGFRFTRHVISILSQKMRPSMMAAVLRRATSGVDMQANPAPCATSSVVRPLELAVWLRIPLQLLPFPSSWPRVCRAPESP